MNEIKLSGFNKKSIKKQMHFLLIFLIVLLLMGSFSFVSSEFRG